jgi:hypothetical protein
MRTGDGIDLAKTPYDMRRFAVNSADVMLAEGSPGTFAVTHAGTLRIVHLAAVRRPRPPETEMLARTGIVAVDVIGLCISLLMLVRRTGQLPWLLFLYALSGPAGRDQTAFGALPIDVYLALTFVVSDIVGGFGPAALLLFALRFPDDRLPASRLWAERATIACGILLALLWLTPDFSATVLGRGANAFQIAYPIVAALTVVGAAVSLALRLQTEYGEARQRVSWLVLAILLSPAVRRVLYFIAAVAPQVIEESRTWVLLSWIVTEIVGWCAIAYAVLRFRVVSLAFVIDRALVLGILTSILAVMFASVEWFFHKALEHSELVPVVSLIVTLCFALWIRFFEGRAEAIVDFLFFAKRRRAAQRLHRVAAMLQFAKRGETIDDLLTGEPVRALDLASAAVFRRASAGSYRRTNAIGWGEDSASTIDENDPLVLGLRADPTPASTREAAATAAPLPAGAARPSIAVPIVVPGELLGIVFYGAHANGAPLDPDVVDVLRELGVAAGPAFLRLELRRARLRARKLRDDLRESNAIVRELRSEKTERLRT